MKRWSIALLALAGMSAQAAGPAAEVRHFRNERAVSAPAGEGAACAVLDAAVYAHASPSLKDVRLFRGQSEAPYAITVSQTAEQNDAARVMNLGMRGGRIVFDLAMPARAYSAVRLDLAGKDFLATANVYGEKTAGGARTQITQATLFDLSSQHLSRSTTIVLGEATWPVLHVELTVARAPGAKAHEQVTVPQVTVHGAQVPPDRMAETVFTPVVSSGALTQQGKESVATLHVAQRVPVERVVFTLPEGFAGSFDRPVRVKAWPDGSAASQAEEMMGEVSSVRVRGKLVQELSVPATLGANLQGPATVEVRVQNGDDAPVAFAGVRLEMRQRKICFDGGAATMFYGDGALDAPVYDYARLFHGGEARVAALGAEEMNAAYVPRKDERPYSERHPELIWVVLLLVVGVLGMVAMRGMKRV